MERLLNQKMVLYPKGGTNLIAVEQGEHGLRYPVGDVNMSWNDMLRIMLKAMKLEKKVINIPRFLAVMAGQQLKKEHEQAGKESGLDPIWLMKHIMTDTLYFDSSESRRALGYGSSGIEAAIQKTVEACYPNGVDL